ncbi:MAG: hypothetical protein ACK4OM_02955 [Alphaproteobacteria bacterium]
MLNQAQSRSLHQYIKDDLEFMRVIEPEIAISGLLAIKDNTLYKTEKTIFEEYGLLEIIDKWREIYAHPCPQNRTESIVEVEIREEKYVYYTDASGEVQGEYKGILDLTSKNDKSTWPVSKKDINEFFDKVIERELEKQQELLNEKEERITYNRVVEEEFEILETQMEKSRRPKLTLGREKNYKENMKDSVYRLGINNPAKDREYDDSCNKEIENGAFGIGMGIGVGAIGLGVMIGAPYLAPYLVAAGLGAEAAAEGAASAASSTSVIAAMGEYATMVGTRIASLGGMIGLGGTTVVAHGTACKKKGREGKWVDFIEMTRSLSPEGKKVAEALKTIMQTRLINKFRSCMEDDLLFNEGENFESQRAGKKLAREKLVKLIDQMLEFKEVNATDYDEFNEALYNGQTMLEDLEKMHKSIIEGTEHGALRIVLNEGTQANFKKLSSAQQKHVICSVAGMIRDTLIIVKDCLEKDTMRDDLNIAIRKAQVESCSIM